MKVHFIAIGGSVMHNLAIALKFKGYDVTGSDDDIFDPAKSRLAKYNILLKEIGWNENNVSNELDAIILGMHAHADNPELKKAKELGIKIYSFPEYIYEQCKNKKRIVIGGSHGKTTITSIIMHVLKNSDIDFDYMVGALVEGFEIPIRLSESATVTILEGDEYPDSAINKIPKFHLYKADVGVISGIAWDHVNIFPTFENYKEQFKIFAELIPENGKVFFSNDDEDLKSLMKEVKSDIKKISYEALPYSVVDGETILHVGGKDISVEIFGKHNMMNLSAAKMVVNEIGISDEQFFNSIKTFKGASKRLELVAKNNSSVIYKDFAHSPSKLKATIHALKEQFPQRKLMAVMELHTYSSLSKNFLSEYKDSMKDADERIVFYNNHALELKRLPALNEEEVKKNFNDEKLIVITSKNELQNYLQQNFIVGNNLLMMSSGNFDGLDFTQLKNLLEK